jgi:hypothetical protein
MNLEPSKNWNRDAPFHYEVPDSRFKTMILELGIWNPMYPYLMYGEKSRTLPIDANALSRVQRAGQYIEGAPGVSV